MGLPKVLNHSHQSSMPIFSLFDDFGSYDACFLLHILVFILLGSNIYLDNLLTIDGLCGYKYTQISKNQYFGSIMRLLLVLTVDRTTCCLGTGCWKGLARLLFINLLILLFLGVWVLKFWYVKFITFILNTCFYGITRFKG